MTIAPFAAMTGHSRQNTPIGDSFRIISIHFMKISFQRLIPSTALAAFCPSRMTAKPISSAITITCSMFASTIGLRKFAGKILTKTSMGAVEAGASYVRLEVSRTGKALLNRFARTRPMAVATAVVQN